MLESNKRRILRYKEQLVARIGELDKMVKYIELLLDRLTDDEIELLMGIVDDMQRS